VAERALLEGAGANEAAALAAATVSDPHRGALVAEAARRALLGCGW
jgi:hypothetical protein